MTLKGFLDDHGITQRELADELGVHESSVSRWINDGRAPRLPMLRLLLATLRGRTGEEVTFEQLFGSSSLTPVGEE